MAHPSEGVLRRLVDEPAGVSDADRRHVVDCEACLDLLAAVRADADLVGVALAPGAPPDVDAAWARLGQAPAARVAPVVPLRRPARLKAALQRPAVAGLAVAVVLAGAGTAAANDWLQVFRAEEVAPVSLRTSDLVTLPDLSAYGDVVVTDEVEVREVADAAAAATATGLDVPEVADLPQGVSGAPLVQVGDEVSATFTFDADKAARAASRALPPLPPGLDGAKVRLDAGPGVAQLWQSGSGAPGLVVARAVTPTAFASGVPFETLRDYLLSLPGLPPQLAAQLRDYAADGSTLPLPVPEDQVETSSARVDGVEATVLRTRDSAFAGVVWVRDGVVTVVAGSLGTDEVLSVARDLR